MTEEAQSGVEGRAQRAADRLALALEDVGFDVGREFPFLGWVVDRDGVPLVEMGRVTDAVASHLAGILALAAERGAARPEA